jgi:hypothetical protein
MTITRKELELRLKKQFEETKKFLYDFLTANNDKAFTAEELKENLPEHLRGQGDKEFYPALYTLMVENGVESRIVRGLTYYAIVDKPRGTLKKSKVKV